MGQVPKNFPFTSIHVYLCITLSYIEVENLVSIANYKFQTSCVPSILIYTGGQKFGILTLMSLSLKNK